MLTIRSATTEDAALIRNLSDIIWPAAYSSIISGEQIAYMLELMYSNEALTNQMRELQHRFILCYEGEEPVGFASFSRTGSNVFKLHKIYILPNRQGKGIGKFMISHVIGEVKSQGAVLLDLNVNRHNPARLFYEKLGFNVIREEDIDIGNGYWMNDFVMRKHLAS